MIPLDIKPEHLNIIAKDTLLSHLKIEFTEVAENYIIAKMPVNQNTSQPMGILHGGIKFPQKFKIGHRKIFNQLALEQFLTVL